MTRAKAGEAGEPSGEVCESPSAVRIAERVPESGSLGQDSNWAAEPPREPDPEEGRFNGE